MLVLLSCSLQLLHFEKEELESNLLKYVRHVLLTCKTWRFLMPGRGGVVVPLGPEPQLTSARTAAVTPLPAG